MPPFEFLLSSRLKEMDISGYCYQDKSQNSNNMFDEFPSEILSLTKLINLNLSSNNITILPETINKLQNLITLNLSSCKITFIPRTIGEINRLAYLYLNNNHFKIIPYEIGNLTQLVTLDVKSKYLEELPYTITKLNNLHFLHLDESGNLRKPPLEIASRGIDAIKNYFYNLRRGRIDKLYEAKLIFVGRGDVGKTSLANKIINREYKLKVVDGTTRGIEIRKWSFKYSEKEDFKVNLWDFGGQDIYYTTHQFFLTRRSLYIFVWDAKIGNKYTDFEYWLNIIKLLSNNSKVIIVLNKIDARVEELNQEDLNNNFPNIIIDFKKVSCLSNEGLDELEKLIKESLLKLPHIGDDWSSLWTEVRQRLESDSRDYIDYEEYNAICADSMLNEDDAKFLSSYLHDLGIILHYQEDYILRNIIILKPEWGTTAVYKVLDSTKVISNKGKFCIDDLDEIWNDSRYPQSKHIELLTLMRKFELCFELPDTQEYIVPQLLPSEKPKVFWDNKDSLNFEYHYSFMPEGIITRFIVRLHNYIENNYYWKYGVILRDNTERAYIESFPLDRKIKINVKGINKSHMLSIIRHHFDYIHKSLNHPNVKEMITCMCDECKLGEPHLFNYALVKRYHNNNEKYIFCDKSLKKVDVNALINGYSPDYSLKNNETYEQYIHIEKIEGVDSINILNNSDPIQCV